MESTAYTLPTPKWRQLGSLPGTSDSHFPTWNNGIMSGDVISAYPNEKCRDVCIYSYVLQDYLKSAELVNDVFKKHGIGLVTLQPEFSLSSFLGKNFQSIYHCIIFLIVGTYE